MKGFLYFLSALSRRRSWPAPGLILLAATVLGAPARGDNPYATELYLDPAEGQIDGRVAIVVYPARFRDGSFQEVLASDQFEAHLVPSDDPSVELVYPCGKWFQPPPKHRYRVWVESEWRMSPYTSMVIYGGGPFRGRGLGAALPAVDAGRVALPADLATGPRHYLRLLRAEVHREGDVARREISRRSAAPEVGDGLLMPVGKVIAALWDDRSQSYTHLSRPFEVRARETVAAPLRKPEGAADLVAVLERHTKAGRVDEYDVDVSLAREAGELPPDLRIPTSTRLYAVWYALEPGPAELRAESPESSIPPQPLDLAAGKIHRLRTTMVER